MATGRKRVSSTQRSLRNQLWNALEGAYETSIQAVPDWASAHADLRMAIKVMAELRRIDKGVYQ